MVVVRMRNDDRVQLARVKRKVAVGALGLDPFRIKQAAIEQDPPGTNFEQAERCP